MSGGATKLLARMARTHCEICGDPLPPKKHPRARPRQRCSSVGCDREAARRKEARYFTPKPPRPKTPPEIVKQRRKEAQQRYHEKHPEARKEYAARNRERQTEYCRAYRKRYPERMRESTRRWKAAHPEYKPAPYEERREYARAYYQKNRERLLELSRQWKAANADRRRVQCIRRYAAQRGAAGTFTPEQFAARSAMFGHKCWIPDCGKTGKEIDHVIAVTRGGSNWPANLRPICRHHNTRKGAKPWRLFLAEMAGAA